MSKKKKRAKFPGPFESDSERSEKEEAILEKLYEQESLVFCLNTFSSQFSDWSATLDEIMSEVIAEKKKMNIPCEREQKTLDRIKSLLALLSDSSSLIRDLQIVVSQKIEISNLLLERGHDTEMDIMSNLLSKLPYFNESFRDTMEMDEFIENITRVVKRRI
ncbi:MAG: hypothetical protein LBK96_04010 [Prevotellaceae bacterium]|jgi:hypothetical protein|nr:hypothetical protein [Prevotellaceae bacterium]